MVKAAKDLKQRVIIPYGPTKRKENRMALNEMFAKRLDKTITANNHRTKPYYITYKLKFDKNNPIYARDIMLVSEVMPPNIAGTVTYKIDNKEGTKELLRVIDP